MDSPSQQNDSEESTNELKPLAIIRRETYGVEEKSSNSLNEVSPVANDSSEDDVFVQPEHLHESPNQNHANTSDESSLITNEVLADIVTSSLILESEDVSSEVKSYESKEAFEQNEEIIKDNEGSAINPEDRVKSDTETIANGIKESSYNTLIEERESTMDDLHSIEKTSIENHITFQQEKQITNEVETDTTEEFKEVNSSFISGEENIKVQDLNETITNLEKESDSQIILDTTNSTDSITTNNNNSNDISNNNNINDLSFEMISDKDIEEVPESDINSQPEQQQQQQHQEATFPHSNNDNNKNNDNDYANEDFKSQTSMSSRSGQFSDIPSESDSLEKKASKTALPTSTTLQSHSSTSFSDGVVLTNVKLPDLTSAFSSFPSLLTRKLPPPPPPPPPTLDQNTSSNINNIPIEINTLTVQGVGSALQRAIETKEHSLASATFHCINKMIKQDPNKLKSLLKINLCEQILTILQNTLHSVTATEAGLLVIYEVCERDSGAKNVFVKAGAVDVILKCCGIYEKEYTICDLVLRLLTSLATNHQHRTLIGIHNGCDSVVGILQINAQSESAVEWVCRAVCTICQDHSNNANLFINLGIGKMLFDILMSHSYTNNNNNSNNTANTTNIDLQTHPTIPSNNLNDLDANTSSSNNNDNSSSNKVDEKSVGRSTELSKMGKQANIATWISKTVTVLCRGVDTHREKLGQAGLCETVVAILQNFYDTPVVIESACYAIEMLAFPSVTNQDRFHDNGACELLVSIILCFSGYSSNPTVVMSACRAVRAVTHLHHENELKFGEANACEVILSWIFALNDTLPQMAQWGWFAIATLADLDENRVKLGEGGCCEAILKILSYATDIRYVELIHWATVTMAILAENPENAARFGNTGGCKCLSIILKNFGENVGIIEHITLAVANMCQLDENRTWIGAAGICELILNKAFIRHEKSPEVILNGCKAIYYLTLSHMNNISKIIHANGQKILPKIIQKYNYSKFISEWGCRALINICMDEGNRVKLGTNGACELITSIFEKHLNELVVIEWAFRLLLFLSSNDYNRHRFRSTSICEHMTRAANTYISNLTIAEICTQCVSLLSLDEVLVLKLHQNGVCELLVELLSSHHTKETIVQYVFLSLGHMSEFHSETRQHILNLEIFKLVVTTIQYHKRHENIIKNAITTIAALTSDNYKENYEKWTQVCTLECLLECLAMYGQNGLFVGIINKALGNIVHNPDSAKYFSGLDSFELIISCLNVHIQHAETAQWSCRCISVLCTENQKNRQMFGLSGGCEAVVHVLEGFMEKSESVVTQAVSALSSLALSHIDNIHKLGAVGACGLVVKAMNTFQSDERLMENCCRAICSLAPQHYLLENAGACTAVVMALTKHVKSEPVCRWGCRAVYCLSEDANNRSKIGSTGGCEAVTGALSRHGGGDLMASVLQWNAGSELVAEWGCAAIHQLAINHKDHQYRLSNLGACEIISRLLQKYIEVELVAVAACRAIVTLARKDPVIQNKLGVAGACKSVALALQYHTSSLAVAEWACRAVSILSAGHESNIVKLANAGACEYMSVTMQAHQGSVAVAAGGCGAIASISENLTYAYRLGEAGSCEAIVSALRRHSQHEAVARKGFRAINNLTQTAGNSAWLGPTGACEAVLQALQRHADTPYIISLGLETVGSLANDEGNRARLGVAGACLEIVGYMRRHPDAVPVIQMGCRAIAKLSIGQDNLNLLREARVCEVIVSSLSRHGQTEPIVDQSFRAIYELVKQNPGNLKILAEEMACEAVVECMRGHTHSPLISAQGAVTIRILCNPTAGTMDILFKSGIAEVMATVLGTHLREGGVVEFICSAIATLALQHEEIRGQLGEFGCAELLVSGLKEHTKSESILKWLFGAISNLCHNNETNCEKLLVAGVYDGMSSALLKHLDSEPLCECFCSAMDRLSRTDKHREILGGSGVCKLVVKVMQTHERAEGVAYFGCSAVASLAENNEGNQQRLGQAGACRSIIIAIQKHGNRKNLIENACKAAYYLGQNNDSNRLKLMQAGALETMNAILQRQNISAAAVTGVGVGVGTMTVSAGSDSTLMPVTAFAMLVADMLKSEK